VDPVGVLRSAFLDELEKIAVSRHRLSVAQSRKGRRPMTVTTLLKKEKEGTLYKHGQFYAPAQPFSTGPADPAEARRPKKKKGDVPSKEDGDVVHRADQRDSATTVTGLGQSSTNIGAVNHPAEHS
jgi:hypothetical protein